MIEKLLGTTVTLVTLKSKESHSVLRTSVMNAHPGFTFLEDTEEYSYPRKFTLIYNWSIKTCCLAKVEEEFII